MAQHHPIWQKTVNSSPPQTAANCDRRPSTRTSSPEHYVERNGLPTNLRQPDLSLGQNWRDVLMDGLYASEQVVGDAVQKRIAVVQAVRDKRLDQSLSSIRR